MMITKIRKFFNNRGMTLVETMITVAIIGIVASVMWGVFMQGFRMWRLHSAQTEVQRDARRILDLMGRNLRQARAASVSISRNAATDPPFSQISFQKINGNSISYYQDGTEFYQTVDGVTTRFGQNVRNLSFVPVESGDSTVISMGLCVEAITYQGRTRTLKLSIEKVRIMN